MPLSSELMDFTVYCEALIFTAIMCYIQLFNNQSLLHYCPFNSPQVGCVDNKNTEFGTLQLFSHPKSIHNNQQNTFLFVYLFKLCTSFLRHTMELTLIKLCTVNNSLNRSMCSCCILNSVNTKKKNT